MRTSIGCVNFLRQRRIVFNYLSNNKQKIYKFSQRIYFIIKMNSRFIILAVIFSVLMSLISAQNSSCLQIKNPNSSGVCQAQNGNSTVCCYYSYVDGNSSGVGCYPTFANSTQNASAQINSTLKLSANATLNVTCNNAFSYVALFGVIISLFFTLF